MSIPEITYSVAGRSRVAIIAGHHIQLRPQHKLLLKALAEAAKPLSVEDVAAILWGAPERWPQDYTRCAQVVICQLRRRIAGHLAIYLLRGKGYYLVAPVKAPRP